jgi:cell division protein FtsB
MSITPQELRECADIQSSDEWHFTRPKLLSAAAEIERLTAENGMLRAEIADMKRQKMIDEESDALAGYGWRDVD